MKKPLHIVVFTAIAGVMPLLAFAQSSMKTSDSGGGGRDDRATDCRSIAAPAPMPKLQSGAGGATGGVLGAGGVTSGGVVPSQLPGVASTPDAMLPIATGVWKRVLVTGRSDPKVLHVEYCVQGGVVNAGKFASTAATRLELKDVRKNDNDDPGQTKSHVAVATQSAQIAAGVAAGAKALLPTVWCGQIEHPKRPRLYLSVGGAQTGTQASAQERERSCHVEFGTKQDSSVDLRQLLATKSVVSNPPTLPAVTAPKAAALSQ